MGFFLVRWTQIVPYFEYKRRASVSPSWSVADRAHCGHDGPGAPQAPNTSSQAYINLNTNHWEMATGLGPQAAFSAGL